MAKLYFKYGAMGSSKSAQALITKFNYEERGMKVWMVKPSTDTRGDATTVNSRIGLKADADLLAPGDSVADAFRKRTEEGKKTDVIIIDECQFLEPAQIDELRDIVDDCDIPVLCFGLRTDFRTHLFPGSARLFEVADSITEIKTICDCGKKATVNARISNGHIVTEGEQVLIGGNDAYLAMCYACWKKRIRKEADQPVKISR